MATTRGDLVHAAFSLTNTACRSRAPTYHVGAVDHATRRGTSGALPALGGYQGVSSSAQQTLDAHDPRVARSTPCIPQSPRPHSSGAQKTSRRLFPDYRAVEREYFRKTGIFPIMHTVVIRRDVYKATLDRAVAIQGFQGSEGQMLRASICGASST